MNPNIHFDISVAIDNIKDKSEVLLYTDQYTPPPDLRYLLKKLRELNELTRNGCELVAAVIHEKGQRNG